MQAQIQHQNSNMKIGHDIQIGKRKKESRSSAAKKIDISVISVH